MVFSARPLDLRAQLNLPSRNPSFTNYTPSMLYGTFGVNSRNLNSPMLHVNTANPNRLLLPYNFPAMME